MLNLQSFELIYSRYQRSGLKVRDFCANEVINEAKFYYWQKKLRAQSSSPKSFVPIVLDTSSVSHGYPCSVPARSKEPDVSPCEYEILYPCGTTLRFKGSLPAEVLQTLLPLTR